MTLKDKEQFAAKVAKVKSDFVDQGIPICDWARDHDFAPSDVYRVLNGYTPCKRGVPHQIAVKLGLKPNPSKSTV